MIDPLSPLVFRNGARARNRCVVAAMTNLGSHADGTLAEAELAFMARRAAGGFGVVTTCASHVTKDGQGWPGELGCWGDAHLPGLTRLASAIRDAGAIGLVQLFHGGLRADPSVTGSAPWTARIAPGVPGVAPGMREATDDDLTRVIDAFGAAAARCHRAGFGGVELHGAHGYLLTQFLSAFNDRTDGWGGDLVGRQRLVRACLQAVRARVPPGFVVGVRLSPEDAGNARGLTLDESVATARALADDGADFVHLSLPDARKPSEARPHQSAAAACRAVLPADVPIIVAGRLWDRDDVDDVLAGGADAVAVARAAIIHPDWPRQLAALSAPGAAPLRRLPIPAAELVGLDVGPAFLAYLRLRRDVVAD